MIDSSQSAALPEQSEILLVCGSQEAIVSPYGASLRGYYLRTDDGIREIVTRYAGAEIPGRPEPGSPAHLLPADIGQKMGGQGDVLIPFPGRIAGGKYQFEGRDYQLECNDHEGPNAIHGFLRSTVWSVEGHSEKEVEFRTLLNAAEPKTPGYPFVLEARVTYSVGENGLKCCFTIVNAGDQPAPAAAGFHPYFTTDSPLIDADELYVPMSSVLDFENLIPTGKVLPVNGTPLDFRTPRTIGSTVINNCYLSPERDEDGLLRVTLSNTDTGWKVTVWMDGAFDYVVLYSGDPLPPEHRRRALAIEPITCGSDAFNHPQWGLAALEPGESLSGTWGVEARPMGGPSQGTIGAFGP